jgi:hypothetical protein
MNTIAVNKILFCLGRCEGHVEKLCTYVSKFLNRVSLPITSGWSEGLELMLAVVFNMCPCEHLTFRPDILWLNSLLNKVLYD